MKKKEPLKLNPKLKYFFTAVLAAIFLMLNYLHFRENISSNSSMVRDFSQEKDPVENYRNPAVAGVFYSKDGVELKNEVSYYLAAAALKSEVLPKILIVPHAGYVYSAIGAARAYSLLEGKQNEIETIFIIGPAHTKNIKWAALSSSEYFSTPAGDMILDKEIVEILAKQPDFAFDDEAHKKEHSIEVQLPFLQKVAAGAKIVPIVYGSINPQKIADAIKPFLDKKGAILVISADLSHYRDYDSAVLLDAGTAEKIQNIESDIKSHESCGAEGINSGLILAKQMQLVPTTLALFNSADVAGDKSRVVGYGAWSFDEKEAKIEAQLENLQNFMDLYGTQLADVAKKALEKAVLEQKKYTPKRGKYDDELFDKGASFVTLTKNGELRGCVGSVNPTRAIAVDVAENAYAAAFSDDRFEKVGLGELGEIKLSVALLTGYDELEYDDEEDLLSKIVPMVDGLVIKDGRRQALFLPSVWKKLPDKRDFLNNLKLKAGLNPGFWSDEIKVYRFRTVEK